MSWDTLQPVVEWLGQSRLGLWLGQSSFRIAGLLTIHLIGITLLLGAVIVANLHLLRLLLADLPTRTLMRTVTPVMWTGLGFAFAGGVLTFIGGAEGYFIIGWFRLKMLLLLGAFVLQFTLFRFVMARAERLPMPVRALTAGCGIALWFAVAFSGRAIAFF